MCFGPENCESPFREYSNEEAFQLLHTIYAASGESPSPLALEVESVLLFQRNIFASMEKEANEGRARRRRAAKKRKQQQHLYSPSSSSFLDRGHSIS